MKPISVLISVFLTVLIFGVGYLWAFNPPTQAPPGGSGAIAVDADGNVGIGTATPGAKLDVNGRIKISGGLPGTGKVLTSDATGLANWGEIGLERVGSEIRLINLGDTVNIVGNLAVNGSVTFDRIMGEGRSNVLLANANGECIVGSLKVSRSLPPVHWEAAAAACPSGWWVCSRAERGSGVCGSITVSIDYCRPTYASQTGRFTSTGNPWAWVSDAFVVNPSVRGLTVVNTSGTASEQFVLGETQRCIIYPVWCCANQ